jgi:hypothetical protein
VNIKDPVSFHTMDWEWGGGKCVKSEIMKMSLGDGVLRGVCEN